MVVSKWNSLPDSWFINSISVQCFKVNIDKYLLPVQEYEPSKFWLCVILVGIGFFPFLFGLVFAGHFIGLLSPPLPFNLLCYVS